ncbi:MAG: hypothetical protein GY816_18360 [Cytophagales bacterium]|nr:hypothetical protein [Cytophagales bacterium]
MTAASIRVKYAEGEYGFGEFDLDVYPLLIWTFEVLEHYSIRRITYRNYGYDFNMVVRYAEPYYDDEGTNELGEENYYYRWTYDEEKGYWIVFEDLSGYGQDGEKPHVLESILASLEMSEKECYDEMY